MMEENKKMDNENIENEKMEDEKKERENNVYEKRRSDKKYMGSTNKGSGANGALYFFGFIGAVVYYLSIATSFWMGVLGFLKALVWPVFIVYDALKFLAK